MRAPVRHGGRALARGGFTLLEAMMAVGLLGLVTVNVTMVLRATSKAYDSDAAMAAMEVAATQTLDRVCLALMGASREAIDPPVEFPLHTSTVQYEKSLGVQDGLVVWSDPESIAHDVGQSRVVWTANAGMEGAKSVVWGRDVRQLLEAEELNGLDDNDNGLVDETGLTFALEGERVHIWLTLERENDTGQVVRRKIETYVTCRN